MSACLPATSIAASDEPPKYTGRCGDWIGLTVEKALLEAVVLPLIVERCRRCPGCLDDIEVFARAGVALVLGEEVAVLLEFLIVAAGDDVHAGPAVGEVIEGGELAGRDGRRREAGPVRDHQIDALRHRGRIGRDQLAVRRGGVEGDEEAVEAAVFLRLGEGPDVVAVDDRSFRGMGLGLVAGADEADELDILCHGILLFTSQMPMARRARDGSVSRRG